MRKLTEYRYEVQWGALTNGHDFRDFTATCALFEEEKPDAVVNCASFIGGLQFGYEHPGEIFYNNSVMSANIMEAARRAGVKRFVNPIANCVYPGHLSQFREEDLWSGPMHESVLAYAMCRKGSWVQGWAYRHQYGFDSVHLILPNMYGPNDHFDAVRSHALSALIMKFVEAKRHNSPEVVVWGTGRPVREWLYVDDGAEALVLALDMAPTIEPINIGKSEGISIKELAELVKKAAGFEGKIVFDTSKPDGAFSKIMIADKMKEALRWEPRTSLEEGIKKTVAWYETNIHP